MVISGNGNLIYNDFLILGRESDCQKQERKQNGAADFQGEIRRCVVFGMQCPIFSTKKMNSGVVCNFSSINYG